MTEIKFECSNCVYYAWQESRCRRYPPTVFLIPMPPKVVGGSPEIKLLGEYPPQLPNDWCGEHKRKV